jgi:hypothetical protein
MGRRKKDPSTNFFSDRDDTWRARGREKDPKKAQRPRATPLGKNTTPSPKKNTTLDRAGKKIQRQALASWYYSDTNWLKHCHHRPIQYENAKNLKAPELHLICLGLRYWSELNLLRAS